MKKRMAVILALSLLAANISGCTSSGNAVTSAASTAKASVAETTAATTAAASSKADTSTAAASTAASKQSTAASSAGSGKEPVLTSEKMPLYVGSKDHKSDITVYFADGKKDIPFVEVNDAVDFMKLVAMVLDDTKMQYTVTEEPNVVEITRENGSSVEINFNDGVIRYYGYDDFFRFSYSETALDIVTSPGHDQNGKPVYISREGVSSFERKGDPIEVGLRRRELPMYYQDGKGYIPLQTVSDLFLSQNMCSLLYNQEAVFFIGGGSLGDLEDVYYSAPKGKRSTELAKFNYDELMLALDMFYGLKSAHNIDNFEHLFEQTGLTEQLLSEDPVVADKALNKLCIGYFSDGHSRFRSSSYYAGKDAVDVNNFDDAGLSFKSVFEAMNTYGNARAEAFPDGFPSYQEIGNTAYITFDSFDFPHGPTDYYATPATPGSADTVGLIQYAHSQIMREGSPIENVVMDLSVNGGGEVDAAVYTIGWFLGSCVINIEDTTSTAKGSTQYKVDVNGDRKFDENDTVASKNLFCITSPFSFSCGNLVPATFKKSGQVTLLGKNSGGGACSVLYLSTADGSVIRISSNRRISTVVNGSFYDVDTGVEPDFEITKLKNFYDREALTNYINGLY